MNTMNTPYTATLGKAYTATDLCIRTGDVGMPKYAIYLTHYVMCSLAKLGIQYTDCPGHTRPMGYSHFCIDHLVFRGVNNSGTECFR